MFQMKLRVYQRICLLPAFWLVVTLPALTVSTNVCGSFTFLEGVSGSNVTAGEHSVVRIPFSLDTVGCAIAQRHNYKAYVTVSGPHSTTDGHCCIMQLTQQTCKSLINKKTACRCGDDGGVDGGVAMFVKNVTGRDSGSWVWRYDDGHLTTFINLKITGPTTIRPDPTTPLPSPLVPDITAMVVNRRLVRVRCSWETRKHGQSQSSPDPSKVRLLVPRGVAMEIVERRDGMVTAELSVDCGSHGNVTCVLPGGGRSSAMFEVDAGPYTPEGLSLSLNFVSQTEVTVKENGTVTLCCLADLRPAAAMTMHKDGVTSPVSSGQSPLTLTFDPARCSDTGTYVCSGSNQFGQADNPVSGKVYVTCSPRSTSTDLSALNYKNESTSVTFDVTAYPPPRSPFIFTYLGPEGADPPSPPSDITLIASCWPKTAALQYLFVCTVIVLEMASGNASGVYTVTIANSEGSQLYRFNAAYNLATTPIVEQGNEGSQGSGGSGGAVTVSVVFVALAVVVPVVLVIALIASSALIVWLCRRRRRYKASRTYDSPDRLQVGVSLEFTELRSHGNSAGPNAATPEESHYDIAT